VGDLSLKEKAFIGPLALLLVWAADLHLSVVNPFFLPRHGMSFLIKRICSSPKGLHPSRKTLYRMVQRILLAILLGIPLGIMVGYWEKAYNSLEFLIEFFRGFPGDLSLPLFMLAFGIGDAAKSLLLFSLVVWSSRLTPFTVSEILQRQGRWWPRRGRPAIPTFCQSHSSRCPSLYHAGLRTAALFNARHHRHFRNVHWDG